MSACGDPLNRHPKADIRATGPDGRSIPLAAMGGLFRISSSRNRRVDHFFNARYDLLASTSKWRMGNGGDNSYEKTRSNILR